MNLCKRACLYSIRKKGKTLTLLAFLLVMATLMLCWRFCWSWPR